MKTVYVIGAGVGPDAIDRAKKLLELKDDDKIVCVESMEDVPVTERMKLEHPNIQQILKIEAPPIPEPIQYFEDKKRKGHERPYKFHR